MLKESQWQLAKHSIPSPLPSAHHLQHLMTLLARWPPSHPAIWMRQAKAGNGALNALNYKLNAASAASGHGLDFTNERLAERCRGRRGPGGLPKIVASGKAKAEAEAKAKLSTVDDI